MATVRITLIAATNPPGHKKAVLKCGGVTVTLPITSPKVDHAGFSADWQQVPRPGAKPLLGQAGGRLHTMKVDVTVARPDGSSVEGIINQLVAMSRDETNSVTMSNYGFFEAGPWRMTDCTFPSDARKFGTNQITRAVVTLTLTEVVADPAPAATKKPSAKSSPTAVTTHGATATRPKKYTVKAGDTLSAIAARFYGHASYYTKIAAANNIRNPNRIRVGQVLRLP